MILPVDLISQFAKTTKDTDNTKKETTVYGTIVTESGTQYVKLDGSNQLTPYVATVEASSGDRVAVMLKNHTATITGNITSPSVKTETVQVITNNVKEFETIIADTVKTNELEAVVGRISNLETYNLTVNNKFIANDAEIDKLKAEDVTIHGLLNAANANIGTLTADNADIKNRLTANEAAIKDLAVGDLSAVYATIENLNAATARISDLEATRLKASDIEGKYANIDFSNISKATMASFYANSGLIQNVEVGDATISGKLVGVTISGDLIEANTLVANKLVIQGSDGLYYKLNTDGVKTEAQQTDYNSLNGTIIKAKSITATKINVTDLVAFGATIGGFKITENSIYSDVKSAVGNTTRGIYLDNTGQMALGDASNYLKYYKDADGNYKLAISADTITFGSKKTSLETALDMKIGGRNYFGFNKGVETTSLGNTSYSKVALDKTINGFTITILEDAPSALIVGRIQKLGFNGVAGETYTFSAKASANVDNIKVSLDLCDAGNIGFIIGTSPQKVSFSAIPLNYFDNRTYNGFFDVAVGSDTTIPAGTVLYFEDVKIERGNKPTDWTRAPEDLAKQDTLLDVIDSIDEAETKISQNTESISSVAQRTTAVENKFGNYPTIVQMNSAIEQTADSIESSVSANYATKESLNDLEIGGRNLIIGTGDPLVVSQSDEPRSVTMSKVYNLHPDIRNDAKAFLLSVQNSCLAFSFDIEVNDIRKDENQTLNRVGGYVTFNFENIETGTTTSWYLTHSTPISANNNTFGYANSLISATDEVKSFVGHYAGYCEMSNPNCTILASFYANPDKYNVTANSSIVEIRGITKGGTIKNVKFEIGNKPTRWTPAPEDIKSDVEALDTRLISAESSIVQLSDRITTNVTETTNLGTRMSTVEQTASDITVRFEPFGGRNYIAKTIFGTAKEHKMYNASYGTLTRTEDGLKLTCTSDTSRNGFLLPLTFDGCLENGQKYTLSFKYRTNLTNTGTIYVLQRTTPNINVSGGATLIASEETWQTFTHTFSSNEINARVCFAVLIPYATGIGNWIEIKDRSVKLEKGTKATAWTPALEDGVTTATSYLNLSDAGLIVGQNPASPTAGNVLISSNGVTIRKGTTILSEFKAASRTASGISSATLTSTDSTDSESDGTTRVSGTVTSGGTRTNVYISTDGNPVYFPNGIETSKVLINDASGIISNSNIILNASLVDKSGEGILTPLNSYGNMVIGYGRYQDGGGTYVYGTLVKAKTKNGFSATVNGVPAIDTNNDSGNATFGWHLYEAGEGETNIYGQITSLFSKGDMRLNAEGNSIRFNGSFVPYNGNKFNLGTSSYSIHNIYISSNDDNTLHGLKFSNTSGEHNAVGVNADGYQIFGNASFCTNIVTKSTTTSTTGYSFKITCGENPALTIEDNDARLLLFGGTDSTSRYLGSMAIYKRTYSNAGNIYITNNGMMGRSTSSSERYKKDIVDLDLDTVRGLYDLPVRQFKYRTEHISPDDERYERNMPGFIAEEVAEYLPIACDHIEDQNGNLIPEMWNSKIIIPSLLKLIQDLNNRVKDLEERRT